MKRTDPVLTEIRKNHYSIHRKNLVRRAELLRCVRGFFAEGGYLEVETPVRIPVPLPEAHIEVIAADGWVLQPSPEICMKRLLAAGYEKIFQICKCFRKAERGRRHLPEMTMLEWYAVGENYLDLMTCCEELVLHIAQGLGAGRTIMYQGRTIELTPPWERLTVSDAFMRHGSLSMPAALAQGRFDAVMGWRSSRGSGWNGPCSCMTTRPSTDRSPASNRDIPAWLNASSFISAVSSCATASAS